MRSSTDHDNMRRQPRPRRIRLDAEPTTSATTCAPKNAKNNHPLLPQYFTSTTRTASYKSDDISSRNANNASSSNSSYQDVRIVQQELERKLCPVTGILRDISVDYRIFSKILGRGHHGVVRECERLRGSSTRSSTMRNNNSHNNSRNNSRNRRIILAVKSIDKSKIRRLDHLQREIQLLRKMNHHNIIKMIDCYEDAERVHIITERYTGGELFDLIHKKANAQTTTGCLSEKRAARIMKSLLEAVSYLHDRDIVHRDIKLENILFESEKGSCEEEEDYGDDGDDSIKLIDFGLSRRHKRDVDRPMKNHVGTAYYMAPELLKGRYDRACDVWSLGTIAYIMLCGYPPFNGETDNEIFDAIKYDRYEFSSSAWSNKSTGAKDFVRCLMKKDPRRRMTAREALEHPWIIRNSRSCTSSDDVATTPHNRGVNKDVPVKLGQHHPQQDIMASVQKLRLSINRIKLNRSGRQR